MRLTATLIACALPLAACDKGPEVRAENATAEEVAKEVAAAGGADSFVRPGRWESKVTIEQMTIPGMPAEVASQMKDFEGRVETSHSCLTPEEAKRPKEDFFTGENKSCRYDRFTMAGGKIDAVMKCAEQGRTNVMTLQGSYTPETYNMRMTMQGAAQGEAGGMTMRMRVEAKRLGQCTGDEDQGVAG